MCIGVLWLNLFASCVLMQPLETLTPMLIDPRFTGSQPWQLEAVAKVRAWVCAWAWQQMELGAKQPHVAHLLFRLAL